MSRAHRGGVDSIKVDRTFVMFPSFRMLSQSFYQWADHRDRERGSEREREYTAGKRNVFATVSAVGLWTKNSLLKRVLCPFWTRKHTHFTLLEICFVFFFQLLHINNLLSFVCDFPERGGGERLGKL